MYCRGLCFHFCPSVYVQVELAQLTWSRFKKFLTNFDVVWQQGYVICLLSTARWSLAMQVGNLFYIKKWCPDIMSVTMEWPFTHYVLAYVKHRLAVCTIALSRYARLCNISLFRGFRVFFTVFFSLSLAFSVLFNGAHTIHTHTCTHKHTQEHENANYECVLSCTCTWMWVCVGRVICQGGQGRLS